MKVADVIRLAFMKMAGCSSQHEADFFFTGQFKHATKPGRVTVSGKPSDDLAPGTLISIYKQAGLRR